ncbi:DoxX family protein [Paraflavitalea sp. CAU 1676]|uniref:DoxX family protein n=1 Tax=Paraflavitalea sp. CAU 1676 TaxID=3032598 RepID=UPI0023DC09B4|nr:DoxX family protein [Paraflavitalea sp. CAU 1676]MDF2193373.1 DoxX family protein [Paraflavitalea sp. CAU 1676]
MKKAHKIIYWVATAWLALGMLSTGYVQLFHLKDETKFILDLGYPEYLLTLLGITKVLGVLVVLIPKFPLLKEWAYAGFFFMMAGAIYSHIAAGNPGGIFPPLLLLILTVVSWYFRPATRKLALANQ